MAGDTSMTRLTVVGDAHLSPAERLLRTVKSTLSGQFDVLGELGRGTEGKIVYLAREVATKHLVALQLVPAAGTTVGSQDWWVEVLRRLDASVPAIESTCPVCNKQLRGWGRFCPHCGADLSGVAPEQQTTTDDLMRAVRDSARGKYEILGQMDRAEGGGIVYFARDIKRNKIVALRLIKEYDSQRGTEQYNIGVTRVLSSVAESLGAQAGTQVSPPRKPAPPPPPPRVIGDPPPPPPPPPPPVAPPPPQRPPSQLTRNQIIAIGVAAALFVAIILWALTRRPQQTAVVPPPDTQVAAVTPPPPVVPDSADVDIGGTLPEGAVVSVDGATATLFPIRVAPGSHTFRVTAPGYQPTSQVLDVRPRQAVMWTPQMVKGGTAPRPQVQAPPPRIRTTPPAAKGPSTRGQDAALPSDSTLPTNAPPRETPRPADKNAAQTDIPNTTCASLFSRLEWSRALRACEEESNAGSTVAQRTLGTIYERGLGTTQQPKLAAQLYQKAADGGDAIAQFRLGAMMLKGSGVKKDERGAMAWFRRAADQGQMDALNTLASALERGEGIKKNKADAVQLYQRGSDLGNAQAEARLAAYYAVGDVVRRDDKMAFDLFKKAADQGNAEAQYRLGDIYQRGIGVQKSVTDAKRYYELAAKQNHAKAKDALKRLR